MKKRSLLKPILYTLCSIIAVVSLAAWIFFTFYFEGMLNKVFIPKIEQAALKATHGRFALTLDKIYYKHTSSPMRGTLVCNTFILSRIAYDSGEHGIVLERITLDSARFEGIRWWDVLWQKDLTLTSLKLTTPDLYMINIDTGTRLPIISKYVAIKNATPSDRQVISFDSIVLRDISVFLPMESGNDMIPAYRNISITLTNFSLDPEAASRESSLFSKNVEFVLPGGNYPVSDSTYSIQVHGIHGSFSDSLVTIDSVAYLPNYDEQAFADKYKYSQGRLEFRCTGMELRGINFTKLLDRGGLSIRSLEVASWFADYYRDMRIPADPHPPNAVLPHAIITSIKAPIMLDSIIFNNGTIHHRERMTGSTHASLLTFTHARVTEHPFCTDTTNPLYREPLHFDVNALFMDEGKVVGTVVYPIHQKQFDLHLQATVGPFDLPVLNSYLVSNVRKEITKGKCLGGELRMDVHNGVGITTVSPRYEDVSMSVLTTSVKDKSGILEGIQSFIANTFVLRTNNVDNGDTKAVSGTTTYIYSKDEEFFQYIWLALRKSIGKVVGF
jgi:hypothetical protein